ncbi:MAG: hypothetical protein AB8F74_07345 [Saprospiraceae bacterium]
MKYLLCLLLLGTFGFNLMATTSAVVWPHSTICEKDTVAPKVFIIGDYEKQYQDLLSEHEMLLLTACDNDMNVAFEKWQGMLLAMEEHSEAVKYDLRGLKMWLNIFWDEDGTVNHIAYYLKPNSRNADTERLTMFFRDFMNNYRFPLIVGEKFSHYGMATFPTFIKRPKPTANLPGGAQQTGDSVTVPGNKDK